MSPFPLLGIEANGLKWKGKLHIRKFIPNDIPNAEINPSDCLGKVLSNLSKATWLPDDFTELVDQWERVEEDEEITKNDYIDFLNELYDLCDYYRILIC